MTDLEYIKAWLKDDYARENTLSDRDIEVLESVAKKLEELPLRRKEAKRFRMKYINYRNLYDKAQENIGKVKKEINEMLETEEPEEVTFNAGLRCALNIIDKYTKGGAE